ncbi:geranylgeranylglycerol-phosphate geranylgeranyltransferase [Roseivirga sp. BDSF3-8]|uniref:geranylgeranylglycerol-phosphate geranylgeranyltransferase n=1 Tax=Roseivirga sp. BDSF3-8 TaxID=3241598 RepID=UPI0035319384
MTKSPTAKAHPPMAAPHSDQRKSFGPEPPADPGLRGFWHMVARLIRVQNLGIIVLTQYMAALFLAGEPPQWKRYLLDPDLFLISLSTICIAAAGYIINDYYDVKIDYINKPDKVVIGKGLTRRKAMLAHTILNFAGVAMAILVSWQIGLIHLTSSFLLWLYSNQLKRIAFVGNFTVALLTAASLLVIAVHYPYHPFLITTYAIYAFSITLVREIIKDLEDVRGDRSFGCKTLPIVWGMRKTKSFLYVLCGLFIFILFYMASYLQNTVLNIYFLLLIVPITLFVYKLVYADTRRAFGTLSTYCKLLMLSGILSMIFF